jgi:hypothetical protein
VSEVDRIFDELEKNAGGAGRSSMLTIINLGMIAVIIASIAIWLKLNNYENKYR